MPRDVTLIDDTGATWVRHLCRCGAGVVWTVLGDPAGLCRDCQRSRHAEPLGWRRREHDGIRRFAIHEAQYHGGVSFHDTA